MKKELSKADAKKAMEDYFSSGKLSAERTRKMKRLAMKYKISLKDYRKKFCKKCFSDLQKGKIRITKNYKTIECKECGYKNRWKLN
ncbi:hypothetical protein CO038_01225 [Candidatus Pacearchaeota archaeon CG_4_9_14_0_2_um_filter_39_13]|nr:hypothetical protein [Candidatus Pacearchaeota archaeon]OIO43214.1 MAG: hypothetical protein AUJ64_02645 [Candidatus Pacearchaeota archaeon CG1_02_39_14]PJC44911.1 MAG: hypothetical protein CO038_01225 [Candidatus Pacearchaeota archaeon CG_4_9_14_0_2_um_filter_39_13]